MPKNLRHTRGTFATRKFVHDPRSKIVKPSFLQVEAAQEFVPEVRLFKAADIKPRRPRGR